MAIHISVPSNKATDYPSHRLWLIRTSRKHGSSVPGHVDDRLCTEPPPNRLTELHFLVRISGTVKKARPWRRCVMCCKLVRKEPIHCFPNCKAAFVYHGDPHCQVHFVEFLSAVCSNNEVYNYKSFSYESEVNILSIYFIWIKCINLKKCWKINAMIKNTTAKNWGKEVNKNYTL